MKINIDLIKKNSNMLTFYLIGSMNFNAEFPTLMRFCLLQGYLNVRQSRNDFFKPTFPPKNKRMNFTLLL